MTRRNGALNTEPISRLKLSTNSGWTFATSMCHTLIFLSTQVAIINPETFFDIATAKADHNGPPTSTYARYFIHQINLNCPIPLRLTHQYYPTDLQVRYQHQHSNAVPISLFFSSTGCALLSNPPVSNPYSFSLRCCAFCNPSEWFVC